MKKYYIITLDGRRDDLATVVDYNLNDVDITKFWHTNKLNASLPARMELFINDLNIEKTDLMGNPLSLLIFSKKILDILSPIIKDDIQIFYAPLYNNKDKKKINEFYIVQPFKEFECIDLEKTRHKYATIGDKRLILFSPYTIINKQVPNNVNIFRIKEFNYSQIVSVSILKTLIGHKINGVAFIECETV